MNDIQCEVNITIIIIIIIAHYSYLIQKVMSCIEENDCHVQHFSGLFLISVTVFCFLRRKLCMFIKVRSVFANTSEEFNTFYKYTVD